jgi:hypothetical protein
MLIVWTRQPGDLADSSTGAHLHRGPAWLRRRPLEAIVVAVLCEHAPFARPGLASVFGFGCFFRFWILQHAHTREGCGEGEV